MQTLNERVITLLKLTIWLIITVSCLITMVLNPTAKFIYLLFMVITFADWIFFNNKSENKKFFLSEIKFIHVLGMVGVFSAIYVAAEFWEKIKNNLSLSDGLALQLFALIAIPLVLLRYYKKIRESKT